MTYCKMIHFSNQQIFIECLPSARYCSGEGVAISYKQIQFLNPTELQVRMANQ